MGDKIEYSDLFSPDAFSKAVEGINSIKVAFEGLSNEFKQILVEQKQFQEGFKVKSYDDILKLNKSLDDSVKTIKEYTATQEAVKQSEIELAKIRAANAKALQEEEKAKQQAIRTEKLSNSQKEKQLSLYQNESKRLNELRKAYKELALAGRENGVVAKGLIQDIQQLDAKLKKVDASVGQFQRNVGNYTGALDTFRTGVTNILGAAGIGIGLSEGINFLKESFNEFANAEKATKNLGFALTNVGGEGSEALEKLTNQADELEESLGLFESEDIQVLQKDLVNLGASSSQVEKLTPKILDLAKATGKDLGEATDIVIKAINGQTKGLKEVGLEFESTGTRTGNYNILLEKLDKFQGAAAASAETLEGKQQRISIAWGNVKEAVGGFLADYGTTLLDFYDVVTQKATLWDKALIKIKEYYKEEASNFVQTKSLKELEEARNKLLQQREDILKSGKSATEQRKDLEVITIKTKALTDAINEQINANKRNQNVFKNNKLLGDKKEDISTGTFEDALRKQQEELQKEQELLDYEYNKAKKERDQQQRDEDFAAAQKEADRLMALEEEARKKKEEADKKAAEDAKKRKEEELKELFDMASKVLDIAEKEIKAKEKLREDALNKEIEDREKNVERQRELADKGLQNTLAFEEQRLAEAERRKEDEAKKSLKREKTLAFFKLFAANAEKDPNTALQKTIVETLLADAVAGAFFKGTEKVSDDLKGNKVHNGRDGYVVAVDGSERVLTGEQNKMIGNMSNEDLAKLANDYQNGLLPKYAITDSMSTISTAQNMVNSAQLHQLVSLNKNIEDLKQTIINKKEVGIAIDNFGNVLRTEIENGVKRVEIIKNNKPRI